MCEIMRAYMGVPRKMRESHWGTYFIWPLRWRGFLGGSRMSSNIVSLHLPTRERTFHFSLHRQKICIQMDDLEALSESILVPKSQNNDCNFIDLIKFLIVAHSEHQFTVMCLTGDSLKSQQLDVLSSRISRAFVLSRSAAVFLIRPPHFLHHFNIWENSRGSDRSQHEMF